MKKLLIFLIPFISINIIAQIYPDDINFRAPDYTDISVLNDGDIYKIEISEEGIYKISYDYLKNMGIDISNINPSNIKIYGNGGGKLKQLIDDNYIDDLTEVPIFIEGESDNKFDKNDYILFYAEGPNKWDFDRKNRSINFSKNIYSNSNYYFIKISNDKGKRISELSIQGVPTYESDKIDAFATYENDKINLLGNYNKTEGTGQQWFGENISNNNEIDFSSKFKDFKFDKNEDIRLKVTFAGRDQSTSQLSVTTNTKTITSNISSVSISSIYSPYANINIVSDTYKISDDNVKIKIKYSGDKGWLDKIEINGRKKAIFEDKPLIVSDIYAPKNTIASIKINNLSSNNIIWDITSPGKIAYIDFQKNQNSIVYKTNQSHKFIVFAKNSTFLTPGVSTSIENQNLHGLNDAEMIVIYHKDFEAPALKFADYRQTHSNIKVYPVNIDKVFNEFSSGKFDPTAIRDFVKMLKVKNSNFKYLLLVGDGSFDARGIMRKKDNFIPVYETKRSLNAISCFPSDDYFGLLSYGEGLGLDGKLDIAIGRIPVRTEKQAEIYIQKIIDYETDIKHFGDWVNNITLTADDVDDSSDVAHLIGAEKIYNSVKSKYPIFNTNKIYLDAFIQENNAGGQRYPDVNKAINSSFYNGHLIYVYVGHGGPKGLAQERVLQKNDINSWNNKYKLPLLITATCSFTSFDDPKEDTAGETAFLKEKGGVIGLFSTVRAVYSPNNDALMNSTFNSIFKNDSTKHLPIGEILKLAKNITGSDTENNKRKFALFGDPSLCLKFPKSRVFTTKINGKDIVSQGITDTLSALEKVNIQGFIGNTTGQINNNFNGKIYVTIFDKPQNLKTNRNDNEGNVLKFTLQNSILFKGLAEVKNGEFDISFILPKDINYKFGLGKISYYAIDDNLNQAAGIYKGIIIGGTSKNIVEDKIGPTIELYMNDQGFAYGGMTNSEPILIGFLEDENGINISSSSIGHELSGDLDNNSDDRLLLNNFYKSEINNFRKGSFAYPLSKLEPGKHKIKVQAWDIFNNKSEKIIEFVVVDKNEKSLKHVLNYPNPFTTNTIFRFEHDLPDNNLDVVINIFTLSGKLVKSIRHNTNPIGFQVDDITWNGTDDYGTKLANGIYIYKIKVFSTEYNITRESKFEKLVILK